MKMKRRQAKRHRSSSSDSCTSSTSNSSSDSISSSSSSTSSSSSSSSSTSSGNSRKNNIKHRHKRSKSSDDDVKIKKVKHSKVHIVKKKMKKSTKKSKPLKNTKPQIKPDATVQSECSDIPITLMNAPKSLAPLTKEEWEKQQSKVKRVFDESTGRHRLIKGDGEVLEEIVNPERHKAINKQATKGDGDYFQAKVNANAGLSKK